MSDNNFHQNMLVHQHHLETLIDYTLTINSFKDFNKIINHFLLTLMGKFLISKIVFYISNNSKFKLIQSKGVIVDKKFYEIDLSADGIDNVIVSELKANYSLNHFKEIKIEQKFIGIIFYNFHPIKENFRNNEINLFESIVSLTSVVIENSLMIQNLDELNRQLHIKISQTKSLFELSKELSLLLNESDVYRFLSYTVMGNFMLNRFALITLNENQKIILGSNFDNEMIQNFIDELDINSINSSIVLENKNRSETKKLGISLIIPLVIKNKISGLMICGEKMTGSLFTKDEIEFLESLASIAAISLENIKLFREMIEKQKIEADIRIAREIQKNLLPENFPHSDIYEIFGMNIPSKKVGGDYFDCFRISEDKILILIADVVGKGIPASLIMSNLQAMIKTISSKNFEIKGATRDINNLMKKNLSIGNFITFFWGILDEKNKTFEYVNAGHNPPFLIRKDETKKLEKGGIILGIMELPTQYESEILKLQSDDLICLYTDGFIEAIDENEKEFSEARFLERLMKLKTQPLEIITNKLIDEIFTFSSNSNELDDLTILLTRVK